MLRRTTVVAPIYRFVGVPILPNSPSPAWRVVPRVGASCVGRPICVCAVLAPLRRVNISTCAPNRWELTPCLVFIYCRALHSRPPSRTTIAVGLTKGLKRVFRASSDVAVTGSCQSQHPQHSTTHSELYGIRNRKRSR